MARARTKIYKKGERMNIFLSRDLTPEFLDWINKQSDLSSFFLYAAQQLYEKTGFVDVAEIMPRKINFDITNEKEVPEMDLPISNIIENNITETEKDTTETALEQAVNVFTDENAYNVEEDIKDDTTKEKMNLKENEAWANIDEIEDEYA